MDHSEKPASNRENVHRDAAAGGLRSKRTPSGTHGGPKIPALEHTDRWWPRQLSGRPHRHQRAERGKRKAHGGEEVTGRAEARRWSPGAWANC